MKNVKAVLFDLDNTLIERARALPRVAEAVNRQYFRDRKGEHEALGALFCHCFRDGYMKNEDCFHTFVRESRMENPPSYEDFFRYWGFYYPFYSTPVDDMEESVKVLKANGYKVGIITNGPVAMQNAKIDSVGFRDWFDVIVVSGDFGVHKPDPSIFLHAAKLLDLTPAECAYVGDHPRNDIEGARGAGMPTVWYEGFVAWDAQYAPADRVITGLRELPALFSR